MGKLITGYSMYFNKKYGRTGRLFEGSYKSKHATTDEYLKYLFAYIHLNPVKLIQPDWKERGVIDKAKAYEHIQNFSYSSFPDYQENRRSEGRILQKELFPEYFETTLESRREIFEWLSIPPSG